MNEEEVVKRIVKQIEVVEGWCSPEKADIITRLVLRRRPSAVFELGVHAGSSLAVFALALKEVGAGYVLGVDAYIGDLEVEGFDAEQHAAHVQNWKGLDLHKYRALAEQMLDSFEVRDFCGIVQAKSAHIAPMFADNHFDMMHLDASKSATQMSGFMKTWIPKIKIGGLLILDDTNWPTSFAAQVECRSRCRELIEIQPEAAGSSSFAILERER